MTTGLRKMRQDAATRQELALPAPAPTMSKSGVGLLQISTWRGRKTINSWLWHGFSTRLGGASRAYCAETAPGELNLGFTAADIREAVVQNRRLLAEAVTGDETTPIVTLRQFHSNLVVFAGTDDANRERPHKADGVMTAEAGLLIAIQTADCIPVCWLQIAKRRVVAAFHAGWRGTVKRIVELGVGKMRLEFGSGPEDLIAAIGPGIGQCCYAIGEEVFSEFGIAIRLYARELFRRGLRFRSGYARSIQCCFLRKGLRATRRSAPRCIWT